MKKEEIEQIRKEMEKRLEDGCEVKAVTVQKTGGPKQGISCRFPGDNHAVVLYPDEYRNLMKSGADIHDIAGYLAGQAKEKRNALPDLPTTAEEFRKRLYIQVVNADASREVLKKAVYDSWEDVAAVARCRVASDKEGAASFMVTEENVGVFQMTKGEIMEQAYKNTAAQEFCLKSMNDTMRELMVSQGLSEGLIADIIPEEEDYMYVLTNKEKMNGANAIVCPEVLKKAYEDLGEPYYVLPSSTHEVLLVKESKGLKPEVMKEMVHEVNMSDVRPEELLSFKVFHYDGKKLSAVKEDVQKVSETAEKVKKGIVIR